MSSVVVGTITTLPKDDISCGICWKVDDFMKHNLKENSLASGPFYFRPGAWYLKLFSSTDLSGISSDFVGVYGPFGYDSFRKNKIVTFIYIGEKVFGTACFFTGKSPLKIRNLSPFCCPMEMDVCLQNLKSHIHRDGSLRVKLIFRYDPGFFNLSKTIVNPDKYLSVGILDDDTTRKMWILPAYHLLFEKELCFCSESFAFATGIWKFHLSISAGQALADVRVLPLETRNEHGTFTPFSWKLSIQDLQGIVLTSVHGVCKDPDGNDGPLIRTNVEKYMLKRWVVCDLRLLKETADSSNTESKAGDETDILARDFKKLLTSGESSDAIVRVKENRDFQVHRSVLTARTPVFAAMFKHKMSESETGIVKIPDCEPDTFERFLQHVYTGKVEDLRSDNAISLFQVADKYQMDELKLDCRQCIKEGLCIESFFPTVRLALQHGDLELIRLATDFFATNIKEIILTVEWQNFMVENNVVANELLVKALGASTT